MENVYDFGMRLKELRKAAGLTQKQVAEKLGVTDSMVVKYENNNVSPPLDNVISMAVLYRTSLDYICNLDRRSHIYIDDLPEAQQKFVVNVLTSIKNELATLNNSMK